MIMWCKINVQCCYKVLMTMTGVMSLKLTNKTVDRGLLNQNVDRD